MKVDDRQMRPIWFDEASQTVQVIDQRRLPHEFSIMALSTVDQVIMALKEMVVRGAPLVGVTGAYGVMIAVQTTTDKEMFVQECRRIRDARPTAVNLAWAVDRVLAKVMLAHGTEARLAAAEVRAHAVTR